MDNGSVTRREFLKIAGIAGAAVGAGVGLGGLVAACGSQETTTTTTAAVTTTAGVSTTAGATTTTAPASTTTASAAAEAGREVRLGVVTPQTGPLAVFGIADKWSADLANKTVADGLVLGDGKKHPISIIFRDTQSDSNRAAQVAGDLISNDKVDIVLASGAPDTVNPAASIAEAMETPFLSVFCPWSAFVFGRGGSFDKPFKWTYGHLLGLEQVCADMVDIFGKTPNNKKVAFLAMNNADGQAWIDPKTGAPPYLEGAGTLSSTPACSRRAATTSRPRSASSRRRAVKSSPEPARRLTSPTSGNRACSRDSHRRSRAWPWPLAFPSSGSGRADCLWSHRAGRRLAQHLPIQGLAHRYDLPATGRRLRKGHE